MITCKEIDDYLQYMKEHRTWINKDRRLLVKNIVKPTLRRKDIYFDEDTYRKCIRYCESNYYELFLYEKFILAFLFMYETETDEPVFPEIFIMEGRGNGKDGFFAPVCNFFQTPMYGIKNYNIEMIANSEDQIKDTFKITYDMLRNNPKFVGKFSVTKEQIENLETGSILKYNTSNARTKDGKRPGLIFLNELHAYENNDQINVFESSEGKVKHFREVIITTNGYVREGPLDDKLDECRKILDTGTNPLGIFPFICRLDKKSEAGKPDHMHKANPSLEYLPTLQRAVERGWIKAKNDPKKMAEFMTKRCNLPEQKSEMAVTSWNNILYSSYDNIRKKTPRKTEDTTGQLAIIGIDYADVRDFASAGVLTMCSDGSHKWRQHTWICAESPFLAGIKFPFESAGQKGFKDFEIVSEPIIPIDRMLDWVEDRMSEYEVQKITMDTYRYSLFREKCTERGISIESKQNPYGKVRLIRRIGSVSGMIAPRIESMFSEKMIDFGDSAIMRWYTNNTSLSVDRYGNYTFTKIEPVRRKNDGFMAFVCAEYSADLLKETVVYV